MANARRCLRRDRAPRQRKQGSAIGIKMSRGAAIRSTTSAVRARERLGGRGKPALPTFVYGVGSANVPPKMSLLPNVPGQSEFGAGFAMGVDVLSDWRYASTAGQSAALRTST
jgi:hypothetical protein